MSVADAAMWENDVCAARRSWKSGADTVPASSRPLYGRCDDGDPTGLSDAEAAQKDRVDDGIHRRRDRDADREREDREDSEERCGPEPPQGKPDVVDHGGSVASLVAQGPPNPPFMTTLFAGRAAVRGRPVRRLVDHRVTRWLGYLDQLRLTPTIVRRVSCAGAAADP